MHSLTAPCNTDLLTSKVEPKLAGLNMNVPLPYGLQIDLSLVEPPVIADDLSYISAAVMAEVCSCSYFVTVTDFVFSGPKSTESAALSIHARSVSSSAEWAYDSSQLCTICAELRIIRAVLARIPKVRTNSIKQLLTLISSVTSTLAPR